MDKNSQEVIVKFDEVTKQYGDLVVLDKLNLKFKQLGQPLRLILSGNLEGPSVAKLMEIIGKKVSLEKLNHNW